jgi:hypothetical protein
MEAREGQERTWLRRSGLPPAGELGPKPPPAEFREGREGREDEELLTAASQKALPRPPPAGSREGKEQEDEEHHPAAGRCR